jgi:uncharacterized protein
VLTRKCNLSCSYCFELELSGGNIRKDPTVLDPSLAMDILDSINDGSIVDFYGGEPLLEQEIIKEIIDRSAQKHRLFKFILSTNGQTMPDNDFLENYLKRLHGIVISIDGPHEINDRNRGKGSLERSLKFINLIKNNGFSSYFIRSTLTRYDIHSLLDIAKWFRDIQADYKMPYYSFKFNISDFLEWNDNDFNDFGLKMREVLVWHDGLSDDTKKVFRIQGLDRAKETVPRCEQYFSACSGGLSTFALSPESELFPCVTEVFFDKNVRHKPLSSINSSNDYKALTMINQYENCFNCEKYECGPCPALFKMITAGYTTIPEKFCKLGKLKNEIIKNHMQLRS